MPLPESALRGVHDRESLFAVLEQLGWKVSAEDTFTYDVPLASTDNKLPVTVSRIPPFSGDDPYALVLAEFESEFKRTDLREILRAVRAHIRKTGAFPLEQPDQIVFVCATRGYKGVRFARFEQIGDKAQPRLRVFGWDSDQEGGMATLLRINLEALRLERTLDGAPDWARATWQEAWNVEKVTDEFFKQYRDVFEKVENLVTGVRGDKRLFVQRLFNRLLFIQFLSRKGWLEFAGSKDYLAALFKAAVDSGENFYHARLYWAFFNGLGTVSDMKEAHRIAEVEERRGRVPFLNGGLFEMVDDDDVHRAVVIPNEAFNLIINDLFARWNFTITESTPLDIDVAVDPEMLGKVFEELVTGRHESGSYYTPRPVVAFMCREALKGYLGGGPTIAGEPAIEIAPEKGAKSTSVDYEAKITRLVDDHDAAGIGVEEARTLIQKLESIKVCDPACGSGAYLLGMLQEIHALLRLLDTTAHQRTARDDHERKLTIIENCLYGVDIDSFAVNIAWLRLWLALVIDDPRNPLDDPAADVSLPNLDVKIGVGDSLLAPDPHSLLVKGQLGLAKPLIEEYRREKGEYMRAHTKEEKDRLRAAMADTQDEIRTFVKSVPREGSFDWAVEFVEVFVDQGGQVAGFDAVLANPPYLDSETMTKNDPELRKVIQKAYSMTKGNWDIYIPFFERGLNLLNPCGLLIFITPDKWISKPFGDELRVQTITRLASIVNLGRGVFRTAKVDAIVSIFANVARASVEVSEYQAEQILPKRTVEKTVLKPPYALDWLFSDEFDMLRMAEALPSHLSEIGTCENACATSDAYKLAELIQEFPPGGDANTFLKVINTGTIGKYVSRWGGREMVYLGRRFAQPVVERAQFLQLFPNSYGQKAIKPKLIIKGLNLLDACLDEDGAVIPGKTTLMVTAKDVKTLKLLLAILNSSLVFRILKEKYPAFSYNQGTTFTKDMINNLPLPQYCSVNVIFG